MIGKIVDYDGKQLTIIAPFLSPNELYFKDITECEIMLNDGRIRTDKQARAIHAMVHDITEFVSGYACRKHVFSETLASLELQYVLDLTDDEHVRYALEQNWCRLTEHPMFSLSPKSEDCISESDATEFLGWLIDLCVENGIPCSDTLMNRVQDIERYLYACLKSKRCAICGEKADLHHVDTVGAGRNRKEILHLGMRAESLCRKHHQEAHQTGQETFDKKHHVHGIALDEELCRAHKLRVKARGRISETAQKDT